MMAFYKIRDRQTGKFSSGGWGPHMDKKGKIWTNLGGISAHLNGLSAVKIATVYANAEIVEVEEKYTVVSTVAEHQTKRAEAKQKREDQKRLQLYNELRPNWKGLSETSMNDFGPNTEVSDGNSKD